MDLEWKEFSYHTKEILFCDLFDDQSTSDRLPRSTNSLSDLDCLGTLISLRTLSAICVFWSQLNLLSAFRLSTSGKLTLSLVWEAFSRHQYSLTSLLLTLYQCARSNQSLSSQGWMFSNWQIKDPVYSNHFDILTNIASCNIL